MLDDESDDGTGALARALVAGHPGIRVADGVPAPPGGPAKTGPAISWPLRRPRHCSSSVTLTCCWPRGAIDAVITEMRVQRADVFSVFLPADHGHPGRASHHAADRRRAAVLPPVLACCRPTCPRAATANGSLLAFTRPAYDAWRRFRRRPQRAHRGRSDRAPGAKGGPEAGPGPRRPPRGDAHVPRLPRGPERDVARPAAGDRRLTWPPRARGRLASARLHAALGPGAPRRGWGLLLGLGVAERVLVEIKTGRRTVWQAALVPLSPLAAAPIVARALRRKQRWKGRVFS